MTQKNICVKLEAKEHLTAYLENRPLVRADIQKIPLSDELLSQLTNNYIIIRNILSYLSWQDQMVCKSVCKLWCDAVESLERETYSTEDFICVTPCGCLLNIYDAEAEFKISNSIPIEPLVVFTFSNNNGFERVAKCGKISPTLCETECEDGHWIMDHIYQEICYPKQCMFNIIADQLSYMPLSSSLTSQHTYLQEDIFSRSPYLCGMYMPKIPGVEFELVHIKKDSNMQTTFFDVVHRLANTRIFKGVVVFVTDKYLLDVLPDFDFLNHYKTVQPNIPYAFGGCIVEDAMVDCDEFYSFFNSKPELIGNHFVSENILSVGMFTLPKGECGHEINKANFEMYSRIITSNEKTRPKITKAIKDFSEQVPRFEHSMAFKLSCVGRDMKHEHEQDVFRKYFPDTPLIGCYGNGELGLNHPHMEEDTTNVKRLRLATSTQYSLLYSYSTVFVYFGWGKIVAPPSKAD